MSLNSGTRIGRYEIRSLLGAGGMGEVYLAFDTQLEREVALKFLKQSDDAEKLRRFRQEAKAVSALNHPGILSIYEVGEFEGSHYIVSELVNGKNLRELTAERNLSLAEILDIGIQIGNALAAAHQVGIVHRDIKPENLMVLPDGYVKVLDFGLAKFVGVGKTAPDDSAASTASLIQTKAGMIIGTVNYMSPEQLRGKPIDERTDIWSLGVVLFEMLTHRRPFAGESTSDVIAAVLERSPPKFSEFERDVSSEIEAIVSRALEKKREDRFENTKQFVAALKNAKSFSDDSRAPFDKTTSPNSFHSQKTFFTAGNRISRSDSDTGSLSGLFIAGKQIRWRAIALLGLILMLAFSGIGWHYFSQPRVSESPAKQAKFRRLTTTGNVTNAAISPDGRFIVYVQNTNGRESLWVREVEETTGREILPDGAGSYAGLTFAPDGKSIYYTAFDSNASGKLSRITMFGGAQQEIVRDVDSPVSFSPDGKTLAFIRGNPKEGIDRVIIANTDGSTERVLSEKKRPEFYAISSRESLAWSPDGKFIACPFGQTSADGEFMSVAEINVETGVEKPLTEKRWHRVGRVLWTKEANELLITAAEIGSELFQIVRIFRSGGKAQNITSELNDYYNLSLNQDSTLLLAVAYDKSSNLFTATTDEPNQLKEITGGSSDGIGGVLWTRDNRIIYVSAENDNRDIWAMNADGGNRKRLTFDLAADDSPSISGDDKHVVFVSSRAGVPHIWRMNSSGGDVKQLTDRGGENMPTITPDGSFVVYSSRTDGRPVLWKVSADGGDPVQLTREQTSRAAISPDGKTLACLTRGTNAESAVLLALVSIETGEIIKTFAPAGVVSSPTLPATIRWLPDGKTIAYAANTNEISNVWTQSVTSGDPKKITDFKTDKIFSFDWSKDGKQIVYARGNLRNDLVLIEKF
jgi:serine/threonine protein kinase/Tol biopolymer transport system component